MASVVGACAASGSDQPVASGSGSGAATTGQGGASVACPPCLQNSNCASGSDCAQFAGDQYCAPDCASTPCSSDRTCMPQQGADGHTYRVCIPNSNVCGGLPPPGTGGAAATTVTTTATATSSSTTAASSAGSPDTCSHSPCAKGGALTSGCDACATAVCAADSYCCSSSWDAQCVTEAMSACGPSCSGGSSSSSSGTTSTSSSSSSASSTSGAPGSVGGNGGSLEALSFAIIGDTRPPTEDDATGYPTAVITKIYQDVQAASPRPAFAISTGDYQFAGPTHTPNQSAGQIASYMSARANFTNVLFPTMGNHECDGATQDNCYACGSACSTVGGTCSNNLCVTPNYTAAFNAMFAPIGKTLPYYVVNINSTTNAWTSKFVFVACNNWSPAQATWLDSALSVATTYTFVVRHESPGTATAPCVTASPSADSITTSHPFTLIIAGHTHEYAYYASEKLVIVGNGGAPLTGSGDYGYVIARQSGSSIVFTSYDYATNAVVQTFTVP